MNFSLINKGCPRLHCNFFFRSSIDRFSIKLLSQKANPKAWRPNEKLEAAIRDTEMLERKVAEARHREVFFKNKELDKISYKMSKKEKAWYVKPEPKPPKAELAREFIHRSLYDEKIGYFSKEAVIWTPEESYNMKNFYDTNSFQRQMQIDLNNWCDKYSKNQVVAKNQVVKDVQAWYTASEVFKVGFFWFRFTCTRSFNFLFWLSPITG